MNGKLRDLLSRKFLLVILIFVVAQWHFFEGRLGNEWVWLAATFVPVFIYYIINIIQKFKVGNIVDIEMKRPKRKYEKKSSREDLYPPIWKSETKKTTIKTTTPTPDKML